MYQHDLRRSTVLASLIAAATTLVACGEAADAQGGAQQAPPVSVAPAVQRAVADNEEFSGRLEASEYVELRPRVAGTIEQIHFVDGALVRKGDLLFSIDPRSFEAEVARAQSQLVSIRARLDLAQTDLARAQKLLDQQAISKQEVDHLSSGQRTSLAEIQGAEAALRLARLNLEYTQVRAPIAGRVSRANITVGNLVNEQSVLTTIAGVSQVYAYFDGSERTYLRLKAAKTRARRPGCGWGSRRAGFPHEGRPRFRRQPAQPADRSDSPAGELRQRKRALHARPARACGWKARPPRTRCWCRIARSAPTRRRSSSSWSAPTASRNSGKSASALSTTACASCRATSSAASTSSSRACSASSPG
jgi:multidrug efflux pump subunit AcrA (membrane-fusion protein)